VVSFWKTEQTAPAPQQEGMASIDCGYCGGGGTIRGCPCPVCWGSGQVLIRTPYERCPSCRGSGGVSGTSLTCSTCKGKGFVPQPKLPPNACPRCRGKGEEPEQEPDDLYGHMTLRERRKAGLPYLGTRSRLPRTLCQGTGVADFLPRTRSRDPAPEPQREVPDMSAKREPPSLADRMLGYLRSSPGADAAELAVVFGVSEESVEQLLNGVRGSQPGG